MKLPTSVTTYLMAANAGNGEAASLCFAEDAVVHDENAEHHGRPAIRAWVEETARKYAFQLKALRAEQIEGGVRVICGVSGNFPGSPIELDFDFLLADDQIKNLRIG